MSSRRESNRPGVGLLGLALAATLLVAPASAAPRGYVAGFDVDWVVCTNQSTDQTATDEDSRMGLWDCGSAELEIEPGQAFSVVLNGLAEPDGSGSLGVEITDDSSVHYIECSNVSTGSTVAVIPEAEFAGWFDCSEEGLEAGPDDAIVITIEGVEP